MLNSGNTTRKKKRERWHLPPPRFRLSQQDGSRGWRGQGARGLVFSWSVCGWLCSTPWSRVNMCAPCQHVCRSHLGPHHPATDLEIPQCCQGPWAGDSHPGTVWASKALGQRFRAIQCHTFTLGRMQQHSSEAAQLREHSGGSAGQRLGWAPRSP